jgi:hypothetical protein
LSTEWLRLGGGLRIEHRHGDGSWGVLEPRSGEHTSADHDPERGWAGRQLYVCSSCDEELRVGPTEDEGEAEPS